MEESIMTSHGVMCPICSARGSMQDIQRYTLQLRVIRLFIPFRRLQCSTCGGELWAWPGMKDLFRKGDLPAGFLILFCLLMFLLALYFSR
jgi:hypothetical protein